MSIFNITAQIYVKADQSKQTILMNEIVESANQQSAEDYFRSTFVERDIVLLKILSMEEIPQDAI